MPPVQVSEILIQLPDFESVAYGKMYAFRIIYSNILFFKRHRILHFHSIGLLEVF